MADAPAFQAGETVRIWYFAQNFRAARLDERPTSNGRAAGSNPVAKTYLCDEHNLLVSRRTIFLIMSKTYSFARTEIEILSLASKDPENRPIIEPFAEEILALCEKFGNSGQSGGSAPYTAGAICHALKHLLLQEPISPITGIPEEWMSVAKESGEDMFQNIRCSAVFKVGENGQAYYLDAIVKKTQTGMTYHGPFWLSKEDYLAGNKENKLHCRQYIKSFPFTPKTFYIDVIEEEVAKDDWEMWVKNPAQLKKVWKYYDKKPMN